MYKKIKINDKEFYKLELIPIYQKKGKFYVTKINAKDFLKMYTVQPAEYDYEKEIILAKNYPDDQEYYNDRIERIKERIKKDPFQRKAKDYRLREIKTFLETEDYAFFPNSVIVTCDLINELYNYDNDMSFERIDHTRLFESNLSFLENIENRFFIYIPVVKNSILIIDGQHRVKGLEISTENVKDNYELLLTFIIEYNRAIIAKQFYTINYTQKSVNKSLLYHLSSEFSNKLDEITFLHEVIRILNTLDYSPFIKRIKMLGVVPEEVTGRDRKLMTISQAFLIDNLLNTISISSIQSLYSPIFLYYFKKDKYQIEIIRFLIKYFTAIKNLKLDEWNNPTSIICKTVGVGAFIKVLHFIYVKLFLEDFNKDPLALLNISTQYMQQILSGIENIDFSKDGPIGRAASAGQLSKVKENIIENLEFFKEDNYRLFIENYKIKYFSPFKEWLKKFK